MINRILLFTLLLPLVIVQFSCDSTAYEIEEEDVPEVVKTEIKQDVEQPKPDIKEEAVLDSNLVKADLRQYCIQFGAFVVEKNAMDLATKVNQQLNIEVSYTKISEYFKVRGGVYNSKSEALSALQKINDAGFKDAFLIQINK